MMLAFLMQSWVGELISLAIGWWKERRAGMARAESDFNDDLQAHARDGQTSVDLRDSYDAQVAELKRRADEFDKGVP